MGQETQNVSTQQDGQKQLSHVTMHQAVVGILLILIGILIILALSKLNVKPVISGTLGAGIDVFAVLYIDAQFIERLVEPFSQSSTTNLNLLGDTDAINQNKKQLKDEQDMVSTYSDEIKGLQTAHPGRALSTEAAASLKDFQDLKKQSEDKVDSLNKQIDAETMRRVISFWGLTSLMGMILVYFSVGIFSTIGLTVSDLTVSGTTILGGHGLDAIISGVIVGAGTKPLHDLIGTLQNSSSSSTTGSSNQ
jgi:hypothetical protein